MGYITTLKANELYNGKDNSDVYPVTSTKAVFDPEGKSAEERMQDIYTECSTSSIPDTTIDTICV